MSEEKEPLAENVNFSSTLERFPFSIDSTKYVIQELTAKERDAYLKMMTKKMKRNPNTGKVVDVDPEGIQALILAMSVKVVTPAGDECVTVDQVQSWPAKAVEQLADKALEMSGLNKTAKEDAEKN